MVSNKNKVDEEVERISDIIGKDFIQKLRNENGTLDIYRDGKTITIRTVFLYSVILYSLNVAGYELDYVGSASKDENGKLSYIAYFRKK